MTLQIPGESPDTQPIKENIKPSTDIFASVSMVISGFSRPPFNEEWQVNGKLVPGLLRIPEISQDLLTTLYKDQESIPTIFSEKWEESWNIDKQTLLRLLNNYLQSPYLEKFVSTGWITPEEVEGIKSLKDSIQIDTQETVNICASYPPSKLLNSYREQSEDLRSLVMLGGYNGQSQEFLTTRITPQEVSIISTPRFMGRIRHIDPTQENVLQGCKDELEYYLKGEALDEAMKRIAPLPDKQTIFLGEAAKVEGDPNIEGVILKLATQYFSDIVGTDQNNIPDQCVYFTLEETKVAKHGLATLANLAIKHIIPTSTYKYIESKELVDWEGTKLIIGKLTLIKS